MSHHHSLTLRDQAHYVTNYFISKLLQNIQDNFRKPSDLWLVFHLKASSNIQDNWKPSDLLDNFRRPFDSLVVISSQSIFTIFRTFSIFSSYNILPIFKTFSIIKIFYSLLGTSDILQDSWSSSNAIQKVFYKGFTFLLIGGLHSNGFTFRTFHT
ncbi:hypothetical protein BU17DRAFT_66055 [Hysterangium stoloniferum]|nr:hypothetical protein BU17DRAFT_66055 [Hysterangium stoloniferum]